MVLSSMINYIHDPFDSNIKCEKHPNGCGRELLKRGTVVVCDARECEYIRGGVYYVAARCVDCKGNKTCKVGVFKCLFNQLNIIAHRVGMVVATQEERENKNTNGYARDHCHGVAEIQFIDGGL